MLDETSDAKPTSLDETLADFDLQSALQTVLASLEGMFTGLLESLPNLVISLGVLLATWITARLSAKLLVKTLGRTDLRGSLIDLFQQLTQVGVWIVGLLVAATVLFPGVTPGKLLTVLGLGSVAIGFAFKDIFENFFAGILILWRFPLEKGDLIEVDGVRGRVEDITIRMTQLRLLDGQLVVLPNGHLFKQAVTVITSRERRRIPLTVGVAYGEDLDVCRDTIRSAVSSCDDVIQDEPVQVFAQAFGGSSIDFDVTFWTGSEAVDERRTRDQVVRSIKRALDEADIEIPFPHRTLTFKEPLSTRSVQEREVAGSS